LDPIDEVRISKVARSAAQMLFTPTNTTILAQPTNQFVAVGDSASLSVLAAGGTGITYQWRLNGTNISTATNSAINFSNIATNQAGNYDVIVSNAQGNSTNSAVAVVTVGNLFTGLFNTGLADNGTLLAGGAVDSHWTLSQSADPNYPGPSDFVITAPLSSYIANGPNSQWITPSDGGNVAGGQFTYHTTFLLDTVDPSNSVIHGNWTSDNQGLDIQLNGVSQGITNFGAVGSFTPFTITNGFVQGLNTLDCVITNLPGGGNNPSAIRVEAHGYGKFLPPTAPSIVQTPANVTTNTQQSATFTVGAVGSAPLTYQWYGPSMTPLAGQTRRTLTLNSLTTGQSGTYTVIASNSISTATASATLTVVPPPSVTWLGITTGDWDMITTNWFDNGALQDTLYAQYDDVIFDTNGSGQPVVNLTTALSPNSITVNAANDYTFSGTAGALTGSFSLTKTNTGTLIIDATNGSSGPVTINGGTIQIGTNDANGSLGTGAVSNNGAITFARTDTFFVPNQISGSGSVTMNGTGNAILTGNNTFTGGVGVSNGIVTTRSPSALGPGGATVSSSSELLIDLNINIGNEPLVLSGFGPGGSVGGLHKGGAGTSIFGGPITLIANSGIGVDANSTLILTNPAAVTGTNLNLSAQLGTTGFLTVNGTVSLGSGVVQEYGTGTWIFAATNNSWTGGTIINSGAFMQIGDGGADGGIAAGSIDVEGTLTFNSALNLNNSNAISGAGVVNDIGTGVLTLSGTNTYGGGTHVNGSAILHIGNNQALGSGTLTIGSTQNDTSRVELTGGQTIGNQVAILPRVFGSLNNPANFVNLSGTNIIASPGAIQIAAGGNLLTFESDSGLLSVQSEITAAGVARNLVLKGTASGQVTSPIDRTGANTVLIWKLDSGTWTLSGANTPGAGTTISNGTLIVTGSMDSNTVTVAGGTLSGTGTFAGSVAVNAGGTLSPGPGIGTMTVSSNLTLASGSFTVMDINKTSATNDFLTGMSNAIYGGTLTVNNQSGTLASGDVFKLFSATNYSGGFSNFNLPALGSGLTWTTSSLLVDGTVRVTNATALPAHITSVVLSSGNLVVSGTGGTPSGNYIVLNSTNVSAALSTWTRIATNSYDGAGHFSFTNSITAGVPRTFIALQSL
jgi:autotransporter-associated beta strand protein